LPAIPAQVKKFRYRIVKLKVFVLLFFKYRNLAKISAERTQPIIFPKCGTLLTYGRADVIKIFRSPFLGSLKKKYKLA